MSTLFGTPFLTTASFRIDWLHIVDLGVGADFAGNLLLKVSEKSQCRKRKALQVL